MVKNLLVSTVIFVVNVILGDSLALQNEKIVKGTLQCDSSILSYEVKLSKISPTSKKFCILCHMHDESSDDESDSSEGSYTVNDAPWLHNETCRSIFLAAFSKQISGLNGGLPSISSVKKLVNDIKDMSSMLITNEDEFLKINKSDISIVTSLKFEGINLSEDFFNHFCEVVEGEFNKIEFINCSLEEGITFADILDSCNTINLSIINCSIAESDLAEVLLRINPHCIKNIDLSRNHFTNSVIEILKNKILGRLSLNTICLNDTGLDLESVSQIQSICHE